MDRKAMKSGLCRMAVCAAVFFLVTMPCRRLFGLLAITEVRPASALPPAFGLLFGPWGALGCALGNLLADLLSGYPLPVCALGLIAQFLFGYIPYKLWYAPPWKSRAGACEESPRLNTTAGVMKYLVIVLVNSLLMAGFLGLIFEALGIAGMISQNTAIVLLNNFDFCILLGIPVIILVNVSGIRRSVPGRQRKGPVRLFDLIFWAGAAFVALHALMELMDWPELPPILACAVVLLCFLIYIYKPAGSEFVQDISKRYRISLNEKVILVFLAMGFCLALLIGGTVYMDNRGTGNRLLLWDRIYVYVAVTLNLFFVLALLFLRYMEKNVTAPVEQLAAAARSFADSTQEKPDDTTLLEVCARYASDAAEVGYLSHSLEKMVGDLNRYLENVKQMTAERERIGAELQVATQIQTGMLPRSFPPFPQRKEFELFAMMQPAKEVGGDFYDYYLVDDDHLALVIADVSGKGVPAALFMVITKVLLKDSVQAGLSPKAVLEKVNDQLCEDNQAEMFVTVWLGILELSTGMLTCANAGHEYPVVRQRCGAHELYKDKHGFVLAGMNHMKYREYTLQLGAGDSIFVYTDGVTEATNRSSELFGTQRLLDALNGCGLESPDVLLPRMRQELEHFEEGSPQFDDITMLMLTWNGCVSVEKRVENEKNSFESTT